MSSLEHFGLYTSSCDSHSKSSAVFSMTDHPSISASFTSPPFVFPTDIPNYGSAADKLKAILRIHDPSSEIVHNALHQVALSLPFHPTPQIISGHPWDSWGPQLRIDKHLNSTLNDALDNIGKPLSERETMYLRYLIQHPWGWSATPKQHRNASGFRYLYKLYPEAEGLRPVLDTIIWPEDAKYFPPSLGIDPHYSLILFTSESGYYFYRIDDLALFHAGNTLKEVFDGIKAYKYLNNEWDGPDPCADWFEPVEYFPHYRWDHDNSHWTLARVIPESSESINISMV